MSGGVYAAETDGVNGFVTLYQPSGRGVSTIFMECERFFMIFFTGGGRGGGLYILGSSDDWGGGMRRGQTLKDAWNNTYDVLCLEPTSERLRKSTLINGITLKLSVGCLLCSADPRFRWNVSPSPLSPPMPTLCVRLGPMVWTRLSDD